jgi:hypothetical protein
MANDSRAHDNPRAEAARLLKISSLLGCIILSLALRLIHCQQSLWADEMNALLEFITAPWSKIVAPAAGEYVPNNHVLFTILAKCCFQIGRGGSSDLGSPIVAILIRLPSLLAGSIVPLALAWPMRRTPAVAVLIAFFAAINPWLVAFSDEARGYSLMILLGIVATHLLPDATRRWPIAYGVFCAAAVYTVQVAVVLLMAHFCYVLIFQRKSLAAWMRGTLIAAVISILLLLPMLKGIWFYYQHPMTMTAEVGDFANQLPRFALAGQYIPGGVDPLVHIPDFRRGLWWWCLPVLALAFGLRCARRNSNLRPPILVMAIATLLFFPLALLSVKVAQVRFAPWCALWLVLSLVAITERIQFRWGNFAALAVVAVSATGFLWRDIVLLPSQPIRQAMLLADAQAPPDVQIVSALLTADESARIYGRQCVQHHQLVVAASPPMFAQVERAAFKKTGRRPWVILSYEDMPRELRPDFWDYFQTHYQLQTRLPGRITPVAIYRPR